MSKAVSKVARGVIDIFNSGDGNGSSVAAVAKDMAIEKRKPEIEAKQDDKAQRAAAAGVLNSGNDADLLGATGNVGYRKRQASRALLG